MKYIIDIPNADVSRWVAETPLGKKLYIPISVEDGKEYSIATEIYAEEYTEPDRKAVDLQYARDIENVARMNYNEGAKDAWDFAKVINYMGYDDFVSCFGGKTEEAVYELSCSEAKAKYEAWKAEKAEIRVGDEIEAEPGKKACVLYENPGGTQLFVFKADGTFAWWSKCTIHKTGKNHPEFAELLKKMRDEE